MRARLQVYKALSAFRHRENGVTEENTSDIARIPARSNTFSRLWGNHQRREAGDHHEPGTRDIRA